jgi:hypothetical protein
MPKNDRPLQKVTLLLFEGDLDRLRQYYPDVGASPIIRRLVSSFLNQIEAGGQINLDAEVEVKL